MNENLREAVQRGIMFLDQKIPDWLDKVGDPDTLGMNSCTDCLLCRVTGASDYIDARQAAGLRFGEGDSYGFSGSIGTCWRLTPIWRKEIQARLDQRGEKPKYPWTRLGYPARIIEENLVGRDRSVAIAYLMEGIERVVVVRRCELEEAKSIKLKIGQRFRYDGCPRLVVAIPDKRALIVNPDTGGFDGLTPHFIDSNVDTFTPEDFGLDPDKVELL